MNIKCSEEQKERIMTVIRLSPCYNCPICTECKVSSPEPQTCKDNLESKIHWEIEDNYTTEDNKAVCSEDLPELDGCSAYNDGICIVSHTPCDFCTPKVKEVEYESE